MEFHPVPTDEEEIEMNTLLTSRMPPPLPRRNYLTLAAKHRGSICLVLLSVLLLTVFVITLSISAHISQLSSGITTTCKPIPAPPQAKRIAYKRRLHNDEVLDEFNWMSGPDQADLIDYVQRENNYTKVYMEPLSGLRNSIEQELKQRQIAARRFWPLPNHIYEYNSSVIIRYPRSSAQKLKEDVKDYQGKSKILVDFDVFRNGSEYFAVGAVEVNLDESMLAFSIDIKGNEHFLLYIMDIETGEIQRVFKDVYYHVRWWNHSIYWTGLDGNDVPRYLFTSDLSNDKPTLLYDEADETMSVELETSADQQYLFLRIVGQASSETWTFNNDGYLQAIMPRERNVLYEIYHHEGYFYLKTNKYASNFELYRFPVWKPSNKERIVTDNDLFIELVEMFERYFVVWGRVNGLRLIKIYSFVKSEFISTVDFGTSSSVYSIFPGTMTDMYDRRYRLYEYPALIFTNVSYLQTPKTYEYSFETQETTLIHETKNPVDTSKYVETRILVPSYDGKDIPISLLFNSDYEPTSDSNSVLIFGYGAYGSIIESQFTPDYLSLIDRGITVAVVHPRGDADMGSNWYSEGKLELKFNTFLDMKYSIQFFKNKFKSKVGVFGRSAGGLVAGTSAVFLGIDKIIGDRKFPRGEYLNEKMKAEVAAFLDGTDTRNSLVDLIVLQVPFVDVINDLLNASVPWTPYEWTEWGNPRNQKLYDLMKDYSPYENINRKGYPAILIMSGFQDTRVNYYEPSKFAAKIRSKKLNEMVGEICGSEIKVSGTPSLLHVGNGGHFGPTGEEKYKESSMWLAFVLQNF